MKLYTYSTIMFVFLGSIFLRSAFFRSLVSSKKQDVCLVPSSCTSVTVTKPEYVGWPMICMGEMKKFKSYSYNTHMKLILLNGSWEDVLYHGLVQTSFTGSTCANSWRAVNILNRMLGRYFPKQWLGSSVQTLASMRAILGLRVPWNWLHVNILNPHWTTTMCMSLCDVYLPPHLTVAIPHGFCWTNATLLT